MLSLLQLAAEKKTSFLVGISNNFWHFLFCQSFSTIQIEKQIICLFQVAHQCICVQYLLELSKQLDVDPRSCISSFFTKIQIADNEYKKAFQVL